MRVGFTGTLEGMTNDQLLQVHMLLGDLQTARFSQANHGMAIGADEQFHLMAKALRYFIVGCPGITMDGRVYKRSEKCECDIVMPPKPFLIRNHVIVNESELMIATPSKMYEEVRSGTWATVRYTNSQHLPLVIVWPNGTGTVENVPGVGTLDAFREQLTRKEKTG